MTSIISIWLLLSFFEINTAGIEGSHTPEASIAQFRNNASGAYTLIHDDFGGQWANGIENYADTMAYSRGIPFCFALIAGQCDEKDWKKACEMISHGHQVLNHSMHHKCGIATDWCQAGIWNENDFTIEIDSSMALIHKYTGRHPAFFMFPFDQHTDTMISYLRYKGYAGARAGSAQALEQNAKDPFYLNYKTFPPGLSLPDLDSFVMEAITHKAWAIREVHGVNDESWGVISLEDYRQHLDFLNRMQKSAQLWVGTLSDVLLYQLQARQYALKVEKDSKEGIAKINFIRNEDISKNYSSVLITALATASDKSVTVIFRPDRRVKKIRQAGEALRFRKADGVILFDAVPGAGEIQVSYL